MQLLQCTMCVITGWKIQTRMCVILKCDLLVCHRREKNNTLLGGLTKCGDKEKLLSHIYSRLTVQEDATFCIQEGRGPDARNFPTSPRVWRHWNANLSPDSCPTRGLLSTQQIASSWAFSFYFPWYVNFLAKNISSKQYRRFAQLCASFCKKGESILRN